MRQAYMILAHNQPELSRILLSLLDDEENDIILHRKRQTARLGGD